MPTPHRKACIHCVKSKRRCDLGIPQCHRCKVKALGCSYKQLGSNRAGLEATTRLEASNTVNSNHEPELISASITPATESLPTPLQTSEENELFNSTLPPYPSYDLDWSELMTDIDDFVVKDHLPVLDDREHGVIAGEIYQARVVWSVKRVKLYPCTFVREGQNAYIHRHLYGSDIPAVILDAMSASALYECKNEHNQDLIFRDIDRKVFNLINQYNLSSPLQSVSEQLAALQALIIYQILRLFDGDLRQRANAERDDETMINWADKLKVHVQPVNSSLETNSLQSTSNQVVTTGWRNWIFTESLRRTIIMAYSLQGIYFFLKQGWDSSHVPLSTLSFTGQGALWWAPSEHHWRTAYTNLSHVPISFAKLNNDLDTAQPSDMEEFCILFLVLSKGIDAAATWLGPEYLERYGLDWKYQPR